MTHRSSGRECAPEHLIATLGPWHDKQWWWKDIDHQNADVRWSYERLVYRNRFSQQISTLELPLVMIKMLLRLRRWRQRYDFVHTFECDLVGLSIAFWQSLLGLDAPKHVIIQFIMREPQETVRSRLKQALMKFLFRSVHRVVVSSRAEVEYYSRLYGWPPGKAVYVPLFTSPDLLSRDAPHNRSFYLAAGRSFRDYDTLVKAVEDSDLHVVIVAGKGTKDRFKAVKNVEVVEDIPVAALECLMAQAKAVVVPLESRDISIGQTVILQAMSLGAAVVATRLAATVDYIDHQRSGLLVPPYDPEALRTSLIALHDPELRMRLGRAARDRVQREFLPGRVFSRIADAAVGEESQS